MEFVAWNDNISQDPVPNRGKSLRYICITRPRRFGKTVMANMISSYFSKGADSRNIFQNLKVSGYDWFEKHLNQHNVIHVRFNEVPDEITTYAEYISRIKKRLISDLVKAYPDAEIEKDDAVWDALTKVVEYCDGEGFIFLFDEWDYIYHQKFITDTEKESFTQFLSVFLKDQPYVEMVYMTDILPISKYSSGSELNMFCEYTMVNEEKYGRYFGFTEKEVDELYARYQAQDMPKKKYYKGIPSDMV